MCYLSTIRGGKRVKSMHMASSLPGVLVILVSTLAGGFERLLIPSDVFPSLRVNHTATSSTRATNLTNYSSSPPRFCTGKTLWHECHLLDTSIHPVHLLAPWVVAFGTTVFLSMPTVLLRSRYKDRGMRLFVGNLVQFLSLFACSTLVSDNPSICYTFSLHACVQYLCFMDMSPVLWGGVVWWGFRYVALLSLLLGQLMLGPPISVIHWSPRLRLDTGEEAANFLPCAYLSHLIGCVAPDVILSVTKAVVVIMCFFHER